LFLFGYYKLLNLKNKNYNQLKRGLK